MFNYENSDDVDVIFRVFWRDIFDKILAATPCGDGFYVKGKMDEIKLKKFIHNGRIPLKYEDVLFYLDTTVAGSGKKGIAVSIDKIYINNLFWTKTEILDVKDIYDLVFHEESKNKIFFEFKNGKIIKTNIEIDIKSKIGGPYSFYRALREFFNYRQNYDDCLRKLCNEITKSKIAAAPELEDVEFREAEDGALEADSREVKN